MWQNSAARPPANHSLRFGATRRRPTYKMLHVSISIMSKQQQKREEPDRMMHLTEGGDRVPAALIKDLAARPMRTRWP